MRKPRSPAAAPRATGSSAAACTGASPTTRCTATPRSRWRSRAPRAAGERIADPRARRGNFVLHAFGTMATAHLMTGDLEPARQAVASFIAASRGRDWEWLGLYAHVFAWLAACEGRAADAARLVGHAEEAVPPVGVQGPVS